MLVLVNPLRVLELVEKYRIKNDRKNKLIYY